MLKAHFPTECDYTGKIGTKSGALHCSPEEYLRNFGEQYMT